MRRMRASTTRRFVHRLWIAPALLWVSALVVIVMDQPSETALALVLGVTFEVVDDGRGFDRATAGGSGLTNMRDRVEAVGGALIVTSTPGSGTTIRGRIPVERA